MTGLRRNCCAGCKKTPVRTVYSSGGLQKNMMRLKIALAALMLTALAALGAAEQLLPGIDVFSPGLVRLSERMKDDPAVHMEASLAVSDAFYVRDTSVLSAMLEGTTLVYDGAQGADGPIDRLQIVRGGETLFSGALAGNTAVIGGETYALNAAPSADGTALSAVLAFAQETAILERAPLEEVEAFLLSLEAGKTLFGGYAVTQPFASVRTMSDDGTRLTRIEISGAIGREGEAPWVIEGFLRQPAGRAPKDTFELTATQDEKNILELSYSSTRKSEITKKNRAGSASVDTSVKIAGKIGGYAVSDRLTSRLRNTWTADGETLNEKVVVSLTLSHSDRTPGREMQRMNQGEASMRHEIRLTTADAGNDVIALTDGITLSVVMDDKTVLDAAADAAITVGGEAVPMALDGEAGAQTLEAALERAAQEIARGVYGQLGEKTQKKIHEGLE